MKIVKCIKKGSEIKVQVVGEDSFVQFPKEIRAEGKMFAVEELIPLGKFYKTKGQIFELIPIKKDINSKTKTKENESYIEFTETNDNEGETWHFFVKKGTKNLEELMSLVDKYKELDEDSGYNMKEYSYREVSDKDVSILMKRKSKTGYMKEFNLVKKIVPPHEVYKKFKDFSSLKTLEDIQDYMYKAKCFDCG